MAVSPVWSININSDLYYNLKIHLHALPSDVRCYANRNSASIRIEGHLISSRYMVEEFLFHLQKHLDSINSIGMASVQAGTYTNTTKQKETEKPKKDNSKLKSLIAHYYNARK